MTTPVLVPQLFVPEQAYAGYQVLGGPSFPPATSIKITVPVTNLSNVTATIRVKLYIYEGSILPGHGTKLKELQSSTYSMTSGSSRNIDFSHTTVQGTTDRRDVGVDLEYQVGTTWTIGASREWDDLYYVTQNAYSFDIGIPTITQV
jgi:hypothetical protein